MKNDKHIRVRFAPSPTGYLHLGSARTALFNWLYARHAGGKLVLRIEDTDKERSKKEFLDEILEDMKWLGLDWDEGPFFQSERLPIYKDYAENLLKKNLARKEGEAIIFDVEKSKSIKIDDIVHGEIVFSTDEIKPQVLIKSDGLPAYNFACSVDDHQMGITHVIRGDDHISNTPKQLLFYEALGFEPPKFAHMPLMMGKDGAKLSKRHGAVAVFDYKKEGFLPEALANYLFLLGWSPGEGEEIMSLGEAQRRFDVKDLGDTQARFDVDKLRWINGEYIKSKDTRVLSKLICEANELKGDVDNAYLGKVVDLYKARLKTLKEFGNLTECFFKENFIVDPDAKKKYDKFLSDAATMQAFAELKKELEALTDFNKEAIEAIYRNLAEKHKIKTAALIHPTRSAISGRTAVAGLFEMMELLGKARVIRRLKLDVR
ncbi:MAG: glutamate--tRNA ligase [Candidatus Omnitrophota bacterium]